MGVYKYLQLQMRLKFISILFYLLFSLTSHARDCESFAREIIDYSQKNVSLPQKKAFLLEYVDTKFITKFVLGSNWRSLTVDQRKEFFEVYSKYVVYKYAIYLSQYKVTSYKIASVTNDERRANVCNVLAVMTAKVNGQSTEVPLTGVVSFAENKFLIQDMIFKNLSILQIQQQEISGLIKSEGYEKTIQILKNFIDYQK
jgi:ABC-type transporter MlaC component